MILHRDIVDAAIRQVLLTSVVLFAIVELANADFVFTFVQTGNNVVSTGQGSLDLTNLILAGDQSAFGSVMADCCFFVGPLADTDFYAGSLSGPMTLNDNGPFDFHLPSESFGDTLGLFFGGLESDLFFVPHGYTNNEFLSGTSIYENETLESLDLIPGEYEWLFGGSNTINLEVSVASIPEPNSVVAFAMIVFFSGLRFPRRRL